MTLEARIVRTLGRFRLDVDLSTKSGETVAVLGPNGSGKSTLFRCLAGLLPIDEGRVELDGEVLDEPASDTFVVPERRPVAVVFQDYLLFPNLTAVENVAFGLRARGIPKAEARATAHAWLERVGLADHADHRPRALSGGQAQRVALARALATQPAAVAARRTSRRPRRRHPWRRSPRPAPPPHHLRRCPPARHPRPRRRLRARRPRRHPRTRPGRASRDARRRHRPAPLPVHRRPRRHQSPPRSRPRRHDHHAPPAVTSSPPTPSEAKPSP